MIARAEEELRLIRSFFPALEFHGMGNWVLIPRYSVPSDCGWNHDSVRIAFQLPPGLPGQPPYAFYVQPPLALENGAGIQNTTLSEEPPFGGAWQKFSWSLPEWVPAAEVAKGSNMLGFVLTFADRFRQGA